MIDRGYLEELIKTHFPDLVNTGFSYNGALTSTFTEQRLLPFLVYQNTIDTHHRLIGLYLPEHSAISNLIPVYIMMGQYRKALDKIMSKNNYRTQSFENGTRQVVYNGDVCSITAVDFFNRHLVFRSGRGLVTTLPFAERYRLTWSYNNAKNIREQVNQFDRKDKAANGNIFSFPLAPDDKHYEGVIVFTNTQKFESLLSSTKVAGTDLRHHINIKKVIFPNNEGAIRFASLSKTQTEKKPVSLLVARHDAFRAYEEIIKAGAGSLDHIKTIVIDDFDELMSRWERSHTHREEVTWLDENYFQKVNSRQLQDLYLICRNSNLHIHDIFREAGINYYPWLLRPLEEMTVNQDYDDRIHNTLEIVVTTMADAQFDMLNTQLEALIARWKMLAQQNYCNGDILNPISCLYDLRRKLNSFFKPDYLQEWKQSFLSSLVQLQEKWFTAGQDYQVIWDTEKFTEEYLGERSAFSNFKLQKILDELNPGSSDGTVLIVSDNSSSDDGKWLAELIKNSFPTVDISCLHKKDFYQLPRDSRVDAAIIFYLSSDKKTIGVAAANGLAGKQIFILNKRAGSFTESYLQRFQRLQVAAGADKFKYELLNIGYPPNWSKADDPGLIPVKYHRRDIDSLPEEEKALPEEKDLQDVVVEILEKHARGAGPENSEKFILLFDDGLLREYPGSRHFFIYRDDIESDYSDLDNIQKTAANLKAGDQIVIASRGDAEKDLMEHALQNNSEYAHALEMDKKWRLLLNNHISRSGMDIDFICEKLSRHGFAIGPAAVRNWIELKTRRPDGFPRLLQALSKMRIIHEDEISIYNSCNANLKSMQIKFFRTATSRLIARLHGINVNENEIFTDDLLNDFIRHIEIKRVSAIYKI